MEYPVHYKDSVTKRYETDPAFRAIVNVFEAHIENGMFTPTELREAVILAATNYEMRRVRSYVVPGKGMDIESDPILRHLERLITKT